MLVLERVEGQNFLSYKSFNVDLKNKGLVSIEGDNQDGNGADSNGSGKSSLINAILWCNYGESGKQRVTADGVVNNVRKSDCFVRCYWREGNTEYRATRYRKHKTFKNHFLIEQRIAPATEWQDITKGTNPATQTHWEKILGADFLTFQASCFVVQKKGLDIPAMTDGELKQLLENTLPFDDLSSHYEEAKENLRNQKAVVAAIESALLKTQTEVSFYKVEGKNVLEQKNNWAADVKRRKQELEDAIQLTIASNEKLTLELKQYDKIQTQFEDVALAVDTYNQTEHKNNTTGLLFAKRDLQQAIVNLSNLETAVNCYACGQAIADKKETFKKLKEERDRCEAAVISAQDNYEKTLPEFEKYEANVSLLAELKTKKDQRKRILTAIQSGDNLITERRKDIAALTESNPHEATLQRLKISLVQALANEKELVDQLAAEQARIPILEAVEHVFSPKGVRYHMLEQVTPILNTRTNYYLKHLTDGAMTATWSTVTKLQSGEYKEKFSIDITFGNTNQYGLLSGGEQRKVQLACFLALQDLIASRATKDISIWCCDEIDHALDGAGLERLISLLYEKTKTKPTILVISHNDLRHWIPNVASVVKKENISEITGYLNA